MATPAFYIQQK